MGKGDYMNFTQEADYEDLVNLLIEEGLWQTKHVFTLNKETFDAFKETATSEPRKVSPSDEGVILMEEDNNVAIGEVHYNECWRAFITVEGKIAVEKI